MGDHKEHGINIDPAFVRALAELLDDTQLSEIEVEDGERKVRVARTLTAAAAPVAFAPAPVAAPVAAAPAAAAPAAVAAPAADSFADAVKSPMVGTVYLAAEPGAPNFASVGSAVKEGDTILIIEAMKVMNPITAPTSGTLKAVHVENSQPVEYDQPLFTIG
ncbi:MULTISPECIES: acetyl-CoA carboxylase biotin carboxyl carrier protein [Sphingopyxis]|jgi:acetyl-CoA carboxylase biotin carboxyl carrier protein|uniref:Biotin carboxyl carrier protein of acetyl-CoA carboxylase n=1 Tax=Sphingopyxis terrae subsp. ummariensis TaxID=429001 RepID=A0A1Y6EH00_9SPHN|nr:MULTISPECIES: acetyl-CoA carboxylase biotin carboxyl carrier protein [Sphingopyxis]OJW20077.1 MAG: acetyl-CoA carboxylase, biotin carboxyl carrier protein [Sphingopyxis sp. 65-8]ENY80771.1 acetyl-CoA carboxylase, biotin carboxyl carrier protein [Sphingopyxis sp. MC1]KTE75554.1 acetyl-CoA carboxylase biotin carboxyl carrier protein subunit [Sphingopyxis sp. A083]MBU7589930.1 acetyl-CoA carboxylase biotin carboxyl carrier protein [Sphingopyxis terrae]MDX8358638.1 acetyl-CoA carboxylase biotin